MKPSLYYRIAINQTEISGVTMLVVGSLSGLGAAMFLFYLVTMFLSKTFFYA